MPCGAIPVEEAPQPQALLTPPAPHSSRLLSLRGLTVWTGSRLAPGAQALLGLGPQVPDVGLAAVFPPVPGGMGQGGPGLGLRASAVESHHPGHPPGRADTLVGLGRGLGLGDGQRGPPSFPWVATLGRPGPRVTALPHPQATGNAHLWKEWTLGCRWVDPSLWTGEQPVAGMR